MERLSTTAQYNMVNYIAKPILKAIPHFGKINSQNFSKYAPNLAIWGTTSVFIIFTFTEGIPIMQTTFFQKFPILGQHWIHNPDPQDLPN